MYKLLLLISVILAANSSEDTALLRQIETNTTRLADESSGYWESLLQILNINNDYSYSMDKDLYSNMAISKEALANSAKEDTNNLIGRLVSNNHNIAYFLDEEHGDVGGLLPFDDLNPQNQALLLSSLLDNSANLTLNSNNKDNEFRQQAKNFIMLVTGLNGKKPKLDEDKTYSKTQAAKLLSTALTHNARKSIVAHVLYEILRSKEPINNLGTLADVTDTNGNPVANASISQVENHLASRRLNSTWIGNMESASSVQLQKEMVLLLAEIRYALQKNKESAEQTKIILASMLASILDNDSDNSDNNQSY